MPKSRSVLLISIAVLFTKAAYGFDASELQKTFSASKDLQLINRVSDLPSDANAKLEHMAGLQGRGLAEFGADWSPGDYTPPSRPVAQHLFSAKSDRIVAVYFLSGGLQVHQRLILAYRNQPEYCLFTLPQRGAEPLTLTTIQQLVRPDRYKGVGAQSVPICNEQTTEAPFRASSERPASH